MTALRPFATAETSYSALQVNTGTDSLFNITLVSVAFGPLSHNLECAGLPLATLGSQQSSIVCTGTVTPDQAAFDAGPVKLSVVLMAGSDSVQAVSNNLVVTPLRAAAVDARIRPATCRVPYAAGKDIHILGASLSRVMPDSPGSLLSHFNFCK